uniref:Peptidase M20 domain containing 2 n=1 Tax=Nothobranchius furzeri TaxID=105023 RepID=A0A8C6LFP4_NOTFU
SKGSRSNTLYVSFLIKILTFSYWDFKEKMSFFLLDNGKLTRLKCQAAWAHRMCQMTELVLFQITVLGTPAEESGGGKIDLIQAGAFADIDLVFMAHPAQRDTAIFVLHRVAVKYRGKASHASAYPWEGINALDAAVLAYNNLSLLRQQLKPDWRLHGEKQNIQNLKPNIIPAYSELEYFLRTPLLSELNNLKAKAEACFRAAGEATGCQVSTLLSSGHKGICNYLAGSTDFGNVSFVMPGIHPFFYIGTDALNHTEEYTEAAGMAAQLHTLRTAKALAMTAVDVVCCPELLQRVRDNFRQAKLEQK